MRKRTAILILAGVLLTLTMCACMAKHKKTHSPNTSVPTSALTTEKVASTKPAQTDGATNATTPADATDPSVTQPSLGVNQEVSGNQSELDQTDPTNISTPTEPKPTETLPATTPTGPKRLTYEEFLALSAKDQEAYFYQYEDPADYLIWLENAKAEYEATRSTIISGGDVNIGDLIP